MLPLYGIIDSTKSTLLEPPLDGDRLAGDMLMITRLPNPDNVNGTCTIVSGMHGYSLEVFFKNLSHNLSMFREVLEADEHDCFQAIIPISIYRNRELTIKWSYKGNWSHTLTEIDRDAYLASVKPNV